MLYLIPLAWIVITSLKNETQVLQNPNGLVFTPTLNTYREVIGSSVGAILTSLQIAVFVTAAVVILGVPAGFALARRLTPTMVKIIAVALTALLVLQMIPQPMTVIPLYSVLANWHLLGTLPGLILADIALMLPFAIMLLRPFALAIPTALYEAAQIDGAGLWRSFRSITVPMMANGVFIVISVIFISAWGEFVYAINFLPEGTVLPVSGLLASQNTTYAANWNSLMALAVLTSLPLLIVFIISQKRLINGLIPRCGEIGDMAMTDPLAAVVLAGALDTKAEEYGFVRDRLAAAGVATLLVDTGVLGAPGIIADISREDVAREAGSELAALVTGGNRNDAVTTMARGAATLVRRLHDSGRMSAVVVLGGSNAGFLMSRVAAALPIGCPKVLVSTIVAGDTRPYVGTSDLIMLYPIVDIAGLNSISIPVLAKTADAVAGMVTGPPLPTDTADQVSVGATMFGVTTPCVTAIHDALAGQGIEVQVFHATGTGGRTFEAMIASGLFDAVADITTTELADELLGGVCSAGPDRLEAAGRLGIPQVVSVGALDMANFGPLDTVPERFADRQLFAHNPSVTLMRTSPAENAELGAILARKLNAATGFVEVHVPRLGFSQISVDGAPFHDATADAALIEALQQHLDPIIPLYVHDLTINDPDFAAQIIQALDRGLNAPRKVGSSDDLTS